MNAPGSTYDFSHWVRIANGEQLDNTRLLTCVEALQTGENFLAVWRIGVDTAWRRLINSATVEACTGPYTINDGRFVFYYRSLEGAASQLTLIDLEDVDFDRLETVE